MKKTIALILTLCMLLSMTACSGGNNTNNEPTVPPATEPPATEPPATEPPVEVLEPSEGLAFTLVDDWYYVLSNIGTCTDTEIIIPETFEGLPVKEIGQHAFSECTSLRSIRIPASVTFVDVGFLYLCTSVTNIDVDENNEKYKAIDGNLYTKDGKTLVQYAIGKTANSFQIPDTVNTIAGDAFHGCTNLKEVILTPNVAVIGGYAFANCTSLTRVSVLEGESNQELEGKVGWCAFLNCTSLKSITIPKAVTIIEDDAFGQCRLLADVKLPPNLDSICWGAFQSCSSLENITIPSSVTFIGTYAFLYCPLDQINYSGTIAQWQKITLQFYWASLGFVTINCTDGQTEA